MEAKRSRPAFLKMSLDTPKEGDSKKRRSERV